MYVYKRFLNFKAVMIPKNLLVLQVLSIGIDKCDRICEKDLIHASDFATLMSHNFVCD